MSVPAAGLTTTQMQLEALLRIASARETLDAALMGDPDWFCSDVMRPLAELVLVAAAWLAAAEARA